MTKEELKEAINATIVENGQKGITAQVLADILNEIVESSGSGGGSGSAGTGGVIGVNMIDDPDENGIFGFLPNEERADAYQAILDLSMANKPVLAVFYGDGTSLISSSVSAGTGENGDFHVVLTIALGEMFVIDFELNSDGSMYAVEEEETITE